MSDPFKQPIYDPSKKDPGEPDPFTSPFEPSPDAPFTAPFEPSPSDPYAPPDDPGELIEIPIPN